mmetsp:Transcript_4892/g.12426  ORF Transcript_4892/g.12426 Transcript_4892/m.12426 type:complete len:239 (-) Transcript_4892:644-1360(-)
MPRGASAKLARSAASSPCRPSHTPHVLRCAPMLSSTRCACVSCMRSTNSMTGQAAHAAGRPASRGTHPSALSCVCNAHSFTPLGSIAACNRGRLVGLEALEDLSFRVRLAGFGDWQIGSVYSSSFGSHRPSLRSAGHPLVEMSCAVSVALHASPDAAPRCNTSESNTTHAATHIRSSGACQSSSSHSSTKAPRTTSVVGQWERPGFHATWWKRPAEGCRAHTAWSKPGCDATMSACTA